MTLRARLLVAVAVLLFVMGAVGGLVVATQRSFLVSQVDEQLVAASGAALRLPVGGPVGPPPGSGTGAGTAGGPTIIGSGGNGTEQTQPGALSRLWIGDLSTTTNVVQARIAPGLGPATSPLVDPAEARASAATGRAFDAPADDGSTTYRVLARAAGEGRIALIGIPLTDTQQATRQLVLALSIGAAVLVGFVGLLGWWIWRLGLRPIRQITEAAEAVRAGDRDHRVEGFPAGTEAGEMAAALNLMLDERQSVEDGLRRFVGDASHELRTPLTTIHGYVDLYRRGGLEERDALDDAMRRIAAESDRMIGLVDDLLLLARLDQARPMAAEPVDVALVLRDAASDTAAVAPQRAIHLDVTEPLVVIGDEQRLRQVVAAIVRNALVHTPTDVSIGLRGGPLPGGGAVIEIHDDGPGMPPEVASHAFERFYRGDPSRVRAGGGSSGTGLGLAIVSSIVHGHGGQVELDTAPGRGTTIRIVLPARTTAAPSPPVAVVAAGAGADHPSPVATRPAAPAAPEAEPATGPSAAPGSQETDKEPAGRPKA